MAHSPGYNKYSMQIKTSMSNHSHKLRTENPEWT